jgi:hypothetical protein
MDIAALAAELGPCAVRLETRIAIATGLVLATIRRFG